MNNSHNKKWMTKQAKIVIDTIMFGEHLFLSMIRFLLLS